MLGQLTDAATDALLETKPATVFIVWHREKGTRWVELGRAATCQGSLAFVTGKGKFWIEERRAEGAKDHE